MSEVIVELWNEQEVYFVGSAKESDTTEALIEIIKKFLDVTSHMIPKVIKLKYSNGVLTLREICIAHLLTKAST